ncbi:MAG: helix-turn-helix transcriptional regulator [Lachnospiraceae bacterium]|nr:helix-turn-helix transcriptional regulator [Lachnospiraceae bacterium]
MITKSKRLERMKSQGKTTTHIRKEKIIGQETLRKLKEGTGRIELYDYKDPKTGDTSKKERISSVDTKVIEKLCTWLDCQPNDIMEVVPNTEENADRLCEILECTMEELKDKVPMGKADQEI